MIDQGKKERSPFRNALAKFIRNQRKYRSNEAIKEMINPFCLGWKSFGDEIDRINEEYERLQIVHSNEE